MIQVDYRAAFLVALMVLVSGCSALDRKPETVEESLYVATSYGIAMVLSLNAARRAQTISQAQHREGLDHLQTAHDGLRAGLSAYQAGNYSEAASKLDLAEGILRSVALLLSSYDVIEGEPL